MSEWKMYADSRICFVCCKYLFVYCLFVLSHCIHGIYLPLLLLLRVVVARIKIEVRRGRDKHLCSIEKCGYTVTTTHILDAHKRLGKWQINVMSTFAKGSRIHTYTQPYGHLFMCAFANWLRRY